MSGHNLTVSSPRTQSLTIDPHSPTLDIQRPEGGRPELQISRDGGRQLPDHPGKVRQEGEREMSQPKPLTQESKGEKVALFFAHVAMLGMGLLMEKLGMFEGPRQPFLLKLPGTDKDIELDAHIGPAKLPKGVSHEEMQGKLQEKMDAGHKLYSQIYSEHGVGDRQCTKEDLSNLMFFLQARGEDQQGASFKHGTFSLPDPGNKLKDFLDSCPGAYHRDGGTLPGEGHRGIDSSGSGKEMDKLLPHGHQSLHYSSVPGETENSNRLLLRMEPYGSLVSKESSGGEEGSSVHRRGYMGRTYTPSTSGKNATFSDQIPPMMKYEFRELARALPEDARKILEDGKPLEKGGGIHKMFANAMSLVEQADELGLNTEQQEKLMGFMSKLQEKYPDPSVRFGNEVMMSVEDLIEAPKTPQPEVTPSIDLTTRPTGPTALVNTKKLDEDGFTEHVDLLAKALVGQEGSSPPSQALTDLRTVLGRFQNTVEEPMPLAGLFDDPVPVTPEDLRKHEEGLVAYEGELRSKLEAFTPTGDKAAEIERLKKELLAGLDSVKQNRDDAV